MEERVRRNGGLCYISSYTWTNILSMLSVNNNNDDNDHRHQNIAIGSAWIHYRIPSRVKFAFVVPRVRARPFAHISLSLSRILKPNSNNYNKNNDDNDQHFKQRQALYRSFSFSIGYIAISVTLLNFIDYVFRYEKMNKCLPYFVNTRSTRK